MKSTTILDGLTFPEAPRWHEGRLWFSDIYDHRVCSITEAGEDLRVEAVTPGIPVGLGWLPDGRLLVVITDEQRILRREPNGSLVNHADLSAHAVGFCNDMAVTSDGTAYVGCFGFDLYTNEPVVPGPLMCISPTGSVSVVGGEALHFANGPTIIDDRVLVIAESFGNRLSAFDILDGGDLSPRRDWARFGPVPVATDLEARHREVVVAADGISCRDAEGGIWIADFPSTTAHRVLQGGEIVDQVSTGELNCYAAALGGADGRTLFLCAAPAELDTEIHKQKLLGEIRVARVPVPAAWARSSAQ